MADSLTDLLARFDSEFKSVCDDLKAVREERNSASRSIVRLYGLPALAPILPLLGLIYDKASGADYITIVAGFGILCINYADMLQLHQGRRQGRILQFYGST